MADISKITLPDSSEYNIKDATARSIANGKSTVSVSQTLTSGTEIGSVTVDGTATKLYAPQGGSADALTDPEIDEAVDAAFVSSGNTVTISLTNPINGSSFGSCTIFTYDGSEDVEQVGSIESPTGETTVVIPSSMYGLDVACSGTSLSWGSVECSGGVEYIGIDQFGGQIFRVTGDGAIIIDGNDYDD